VTSPEVVRLREGHVWLRVADRTWSDPLDPTYAGRNGGRWNAPGTHDTLYLNEDIDTARAQIYKMLEGSPIQPEDMDQGFVLVSATLPGRQDVANASTDSGLVSVGLPSSYPIDANGREVTHEPCQEIGSDIKARGLRGVHARSAATTDGSGRELAWFPARRSSRASSVGVPRPFDDWWYADSNNQPSDP